MLGPLPLLLLLMLGLVFRAGMPTDLPIAVLDGDGTAVSRALVRMIDETPEAQVTERITSLAEGRDAMIRGAVYAVVMIPQGMEADLTLGRRPEIAVFSNSQMMTPSGVATRGINAAIASFSAGLSVQARMAQGASRDQAVAAVNPVPVQQSPLFNPALDYIQFLLASVMPTVLHIFVAVSAAMAIARDRHTQKGLFRLTRLGGGMVAAMAGKLAPYAVIWMIVLLAADAIVFGWFATPFNGHFLFHLLYSAVFVLTCLMLGLFAGLLSADVVGALGLTGLLTAPAFGYAGVSFPRLMMNGFSQFWGSLLPLTPYLSLRTDQTLRSAPLIYSLPALGWLGAQLAVLTLLSVLLWRKGLTPAPPPADPDAPTGDPDPTPDSAGPELPAVGATGAGGAA